MISLMKRSLLVLAFSLFSLFLLTQSVNAGISLGKGGVNIEAGQTAEMCDTWIYATQEGGVYHVETTGDLEPLTVSITPNDFILNSINCPGETIARRACITETCLSQDQPSCKVICIKFAAPLIMQWDPQDVIYKGAILNTAKIGVATIKEPYEFSVHVKPLDIKPVFAGAVVVVIIIVIVAFVLARKKKKTKK